MPATDLSALRDGDATVQASVSTINGNTASATHAYSVDATAPTLAINTIATDDILNAAEAGNPLTISGSSTAEAGQTVTVTLNGVTYSGTVQADGSWTTTVPATDLSALRDGDATVQASVSTINGNTASATHAYSVDATAPTLAINTIATDDILNAAEAGNPLTISGSSTAEAGQTVTVTLNGVTYSGTVQADGSWSVSVPTADLSNLTASQYTVSASVSDKAGNPASATHGLAVDLTVPVLTINTVSGDDIIHAAEHGQALVISGSSTGGEAGDVITVTLNSKTYTTTLDASGNWSVGIPLSDVTAPGSGPHTITAAITDAAGNSDDASRTVTVNLTAPTIGINTIASDDVINATEKGANLQITGTSNQPAGTTITVTLNGQNYTATTDASGNWSAMVPASAISALGEANYTVTANVTDTAGNSNSASHNVLVNSALPAVTINAVATDDIINAAEAGNTQTISGQVTGAAQGDTVTVTLGGNTYTATVQANLSWSVSVSAADIQALGNGDLRINASVTNGVGNVGSGSRDITIDANLPGLRVDTVAGDDIINAIEHGQALVVSGISTGAEPGDVVTVTLNGKNYTTTLDASGNWSVGIPAADVTALATGSQTITASLSDRAGNSDSTTHNVTVDLSGSTLTISIVSGDDIINNAEKTQDLTISGGSSGLATGTTVTVMLNGLAYSATTADASGNWSVTVPASRVSALGEATYTVTAAATDSDGNSGSASHNVQVNTALPGVTINVVATDDIINAAEAGADQTISGQVTVDLSAVAVSINAITADDVINAAEKGAALTLSGSTSGVEAGQTVTVTFGGKTYSATVAANASWSTTVPAADMAALRDGDASAQASVSNVNGNSATTTHAYSVDATAPTVTINTIASDDILNAAEAGAALTITGSSTAEAGQTVTVTLNGTNYTGTVQTDGSWSVSVPPADLSALTASNYTVNAAVSDKAGNPASVNHNLTVDTSVPVVTINTVAGDDVINATEHAQAQIISGSATGAATGSTVTVTIGTNTFTTVLDASGNWSVGVPASVVSALANGTVTINASVTDAGGNSGSTTHQVTVNTGLPTITFNAISGDNVLNADEKGQPLTISGSSTELATGAQVTVTLNGHNYSATTDAAGNWTLTVPVSDLAALGQANYTVSASATSAAGDDIINAAEAGADQTISGVVTRAADGDTVTVTLGGNTYTAEVQPDLSWSISVPAADLQALGNGDLTITASVTNANSNTGSGTRDITIDANLPGLRVDTVAGDDIVNSIEHGQALVITGGSSGLNAGAVLTVTINSVTYSATVQADGSWSVGIPAANVSA
ncbi:hypothetical protein SDY_0423 [Shigella dysenteriae Sd197]|uniref:Bacterial Ig-like domain-containing protein n=3 Tax=Shigella dysenteriae TaxID=622 RepID=Q32J73_SHIDS|nr:hypothetical protein SDY_0423 [Shigella dysenteriae Sd197]